MVCYEILAKKDNNENIAFPIDIISRMKYWDRYNKILKVCGWTMQAYETEMLIRIDREWSKISPN
jgi:hypothetical protein